MTNLVKAEWFRIRHGSSSWILIILAAFLSVIFSFMNPLPSFDRVTLSQSAPIGMSICLMVITVVIGQLYSNRMAFYEIMDGKTANQIILYRFVLYLPIVVFFYFVPVSILLLIFDAGVNSIKFLALLFLVLLRMFVLFIGITLILKSAEGAILMFPRIMVEMLPVMLSEEGFINTAELPGFWEWLPIPQCYNMANSLGGDLSAKVIIGCVVEIVIVYVLAYMSYKRKWSIDLTLK